MEEPAHQRARERLRLGDVEGASRIVEAETSRSAESAVDSRDLWKLRFTRAEIMVIHGRVDEAVQFLESVMPPEARDVESCAALKLCCGSYLGQLGRYEPSHQLLGEAQAMARGAGLLGLQAEVHRRQGFIFFLQKDYASSDLMFRAVLNLGEQLDDWYFRGYGMWGIGKNLMIQAHYRDAMPWLERSLGVFEAAKAQLDIAMVWSELAVCHLGLGDDARAMDLLRQAERVNNDAGFIHNYQVVLANIGNVYLHRREHLAAISYYRRALVLARQINDPVSIKKWTYNINLAYARIRLTVDRAHPRIA